MSWRFWLDKRPTYDRSEQNLVILPEIFETFEAENA